MKLTKKRKKNLIEYTVLGASAFGVYWLAMRMSQPKPQFTPVVSAAQRNQLRPHITSYSYTSGRPVKTPQYKIPFRLINRPPA